MFNWEIKAKARQAKGRTVKIRFRAETMEIATDVALQFFPRHRRHNISIKLIG